jgi:hypothetical protein
MTAPTAIYASRTHYQQPVADEPTLAAPMPEDYQQSPYGYAEMPYETYVGDDVPPAPQQTPAATPQPAAPAPQQPSDPAYTAPAPPTDVALQPQYAAPAPDAPWQLFRSPCLKHYGINMGGWIEQGLTFNAEDPADGFNGPVATNDQADHYQLNQLWMFIDRPVGQRGHCWDLGGHVDLMYGTDFRFGVSHGLEDRINNLDQYYGMVIPQAYAAVGNDRWNIKLGHYAAPLSYEQVPAPANFFYSHSYQMGYGLPLLVTGMLASYNLTDNWSVSGGFHRGWMQWEDTNDTLDFIGGIAWLGDNKRDRLAFNLSNGPQDPGSPGDPTIGERNRFVYSLIYQHDFTERFTYAVEHVLGYEDDGAYWANQDAEWYGIAQYFYYTITPKWKGGIRFEWFRDDDGARVAGVGHLTDGHGWSGGPGFAGDFFELSMGLNWRPTANILMRPEVRWDHYNGSRDLAGELPFDGGLKDRQFLFATDLIVTF